MNESPTPLDQQVYFMLGEIRSDVKSLLEAQRIRDERTAKLEQRVAALERAKVYFMAVAATLGAVSSALWQFVTKVLLA